MNICESTYTTLARKHRCTLQAGHKGEHYGDKYGTRSELTREQFFSWPDAMSDPAAPDIRAAELLERRKS